MARQKFNSRGDGSTEAAKCAQEYGGVASYVELMAFELDGMWEVLVVFLWSKLIEWAEPFTTKPSDAVRCVGKDISPVPLTCRTFL